LLLWLYIFLSLIYNLLVFKCFIAVRIFISRFNFIFCIWCLFHYIFIIRLRFCFLLNLRIRCSLIFDWFLLHIFAFFYRWLGFYLLNFFFLLLLLFTLLVLSLVFRINTIILLLFLHFLIFCFLLLILLFCFFIHNQLFRLLSLLFLRHFICLFGRNGWISASFYFLFYCIRVCLTLLIYLLRF